MALNQHPSTANAVSGNDKGELCTQKENAAIEEKEPNQSTTQVIGSALQPIQSQIVNHHTAMELSPEIQHKEKLIKLLKKEVKRMMEESVMLKIVYEESASVTSFCAIVDTCLSLGLKRRALGLFKTSSTAALLQKLAKENDDAAIVLRKAEDIEHTQSLTNSNSSITAQVGSIASNSGLSRNRPSSTSDSSSLSRTGSRKLFEKASSAQNLAITRFRWIRVALFEKKLQSIVCYIVQEADRFFTKDSLVADQDYGPILSSLLVGPCALEFTKVKPTPNNWSDLPAKELVQRHKISSRGSTTSMTSMSSMCGSPSVFGNGSGGITSHQPLSNTTSSSTNSSGMTNGNGRHTPGGIMPSPARSCQNIAAASSPHRNLTLNINAVMASPQHVLVRRSLSSHIGPSGSTSASAAALNNPFGFGFDDGIRSVPSQAREYVESLHQNQWDNLLYGKNNVHVLPKEGNDPVPGYLSLHQAAIGGFGCIKWSPNRLMNGSTIEDKSASWQQALNIDLNCIQFIHCHQAGEDSTGTVVLIAIDGTQHPPIQFPPGGHLMQFLTNIESSLLPYGMLEPPLWSERKQKEELKTASNEKRKHSNEEKTENALEKVEKVTIGESEGEINGSIGNVDEKENKSPASKKTKRMFPFSLSRRKKEDKEVQDTKNDTTNKECTNGDENSLRNEESSDALPTDKPQMSVMDPIDTVFKIVNLAPVGGSMSSLNVPGQSQTSNGSLLNPDVAGLKSSTPSLLSKSRTSEWFANLFSPSKSRNNSSSTDTSRSFSFSMSGEYPGGEDSTNNKLGEQDMPQGRTRSARTSGGGSGVTDEEDEMIIMTTSSTSSSNPSINRPKLRLFKQHELNSLAENSLVPEVGSDTASDTDKLSITPSISLTSPNVPKRKSPSEPISTMCSTMKRQIISRAFYGWLAHCRHLKTVRQHLSGLTFHEPTLIQNSEWSSGLTEEYWQSYLDHVEKQCEKLKVSQKPKKSLSCRNRPLEITVPVKIEQDNESIDDKAETKEIGCDNPYNEENKDNEHIDDNNTFSASEVYWRIYHGGIESSIRSQVWPYLFGHYKWDFSSKDRRDMDRKNQSNYENKLSDWMAIDAIVRQRDKEITAANIAKLSGTSSLERCSKDGSQDVLSTVDEVFTSIDETNTLSSRTVSQDKISTITERTENSSSEELKSRSKLSSGHSEGGGLDKSNSLSSSGTGKANVPEALTRCSSNPCSSSPKHQNSPKTTNHGENIKSFFTNQFSFGKKDGVKSRIPIKNRKASDEGIEDEANVETVEEVEKNSRSQIGCNDQSTSNQIEETTKKLLESDGETEAEIQNIPLVTNSTNSNNHVPQNKESTEATGESVVVEKTANQPKGRSERAVGYRVTTPSVDSGNQSELSPTKQEDTDTINIITTNSTNDIEKPAITNGDQCEDQNCFDGLESEEQDHFDSNNLSHYEGELKKLTQKIHTLTVNSDLKGNGIGGLDPDTHSSSSTGCISPMSSEGGVYPQELMDNFALNLHRIDKDVQRCDRNLSYFTDKNLEKLRNVITTYVWDNLDIGYMQGMCDLAGPLLVVFDDESLTHSCFSHLMERMICNFPNGSQMDENFANMRSLIQVLDQSLYDTIQQNGDFSHFYFCYRWFLLDFKREFTYEDTYLVWETIWASSHVVSSHFYLFVALALVETYRDIILDRQMDFTDIIKFFNEMAEKHEAVQVLDMARQLVSTLQTMMADK